MFNKPLIFWDTSVLLAWLKKENDKPLNILAGTIQDCEQGEKYLACSVLLFTEVLYIVDSDHHSDVSEKLENLRSQNYFFVAEINDKIAIEAGRIRWEGRQRGMKPLKPADSLIVASANIWKAEELQTFDGDMLTYNGCGIVSIPIRKPCGDPSFPYEY